MTDVGARLQQALQHHGNGRLDAAEKIYRDVLERVPGHPDALHLLGVLKHQCGDPKTAEELIRKAIAGNPSAASYWNNLANVLAARGLLVDAVNAYEQALTLNSGDALTWLNVGVVLQRLGRTDAALERYRKAVAQKPDFAEAHVKIAGIMAQRQRLEDAAAHYRRALALVPDHLEAQASLANVLRGHGELEAAADLYLKVISRQPAFAEMHYGLGMVRQEQKRLNEAVECFRRAVKAKPEFAEAHHSLGYVREMQGRLDEAQKSYRRALAADPNYADALSHLGVLMRRQGKMQSAMAMLERALKVRPDFAEALSNLGISLIDLGKLGAAEPYLMRALEIRPQFPEALHNLGLLRYHQNRLDEAETLFRAALKEKPDQPEMHNNLGMVLKDMGRVDEAMTEFRRALQLRPDYSDAHSSVIFALDFVRTAGFAEQQEERRRWFEQHGRRYAAVLRPHANDRNPDRRLRVGYVSGDFRRHSAVYSFGPILKGHDRQRFEVCCYSTASAEDEVTDQLRNAVDRWSSVLGMSDDEVADLVRKDGIDILVDLSGHSRGNRLLVFARKPAPVQVTAWGHATGTGVKTIDYLFADPVLVPPESRPLFAEEVYDLPCAMPYEPPDGAPPPKPSPSAAGGPLTFGCFNRLSKVSGESLALWARILLAVPDSRLLLKDRQLETPSERDRIVTALTQLGVAPERVLLQGGSSHLAHMAAYGEIDIALDPFPQNGGITTLEALWMGVPVIALLGNTPSSRMAGAIISAIGMPDCVGATEQEYFEIAVRVAKDRGALAGKRIRLREEIAASPVGNPRLYTGAVENAYREMWRRWCGQVAAG